MATNPEFLFRELIEKGNRMIELLQQLVDQTKPAPAEPTGPTTTKAATKQLKGPKKYA